MQSLRSPLNLFRHFPLLVGATHRLPHQVGLGLRLSLHCQQQHSSGIKTNAKLIPEVGKEGALGVQPRFQKEGPVVDSTHNTTTDINTPEEVMITAPLPPPRPPTPTQSNHDDNSKFHHSKRGIFGFLWSFVKSASSGGVRYVKLVGYTFLFGVSFLAAVTDAFGIRKWWRGLGWKKEWKERKGSRQENVKVVQVAKPIPQVTATHMVDPPCTASQIHAENALAIAHRWESEYSSSIRPTGTPGVMYAPPSSTAEDLFPFFMRMRRRKEEEEATRQRLGGL